MAKKETPQKTAPKKALETVMLRNEFYRDNYRRAVSILLVCVVIILVLVGLVSYLAIHRPKPVYFATANGWRLQKLTPLNEPILSDAQVLQWATNAVTDIYDFSFVNYRKQLQNASKYFTNAGYQEFIKALQASNNLDTVKSKKLVVSAVVSQAPVVVNEGLINGKYAWRIQMPVMITLQSASETLPQSVIVSLLVVRAPTLEKPEGVAIAQFVETPGDEN